MLQISLDKNDFLRFHLFTASKSKRIRKQRIVSRISATVVFLCLAGLFGLGTNPYLAIYFLIAAVLSFLFFPLLNKSRYKKYFENYVAEQHKNKIGIPCEVGFNDGYLFTKDNSSEGKVKISEIELINEIKDNLFIKIKSGSTVIIPTRLQKFESFKTELDELTKNLKIDWIIELDWKWK